MWPRPVRKDGHGLREVQTSLIDGIDVTDVPSLAESGMA